MPDIIQNDPLLRATDHFVPPSSKPTPVGATVFDLLDQVAGLPITEHIKYVMIVGTGSFQYRDVVLRLFPYLKGLTIIEPDSASFERVRAATEGNPLLTLLPSVPEPLPEIDLLVLDSATVDQFLIHSLSEFWRQTKLICVGANLDAVHAVLTDIVQLAPGPETGSSSPALYVNPEWASLATNPIASGEASRTSLTTGSRTITSPPRISVLVSTYNAEKYIRACLADLEAQTIADQLEIIVIDSGSQQNERAIVEEFQARYSNIRYVRTEREPLYNAWNRGIQLATGKYITNANSDDAHRSDALELLAAALDANPAADLAYGDYYNSSVANDSFSAPHILRRVVHPPYHPATLMFYCVTGCHPLWRRGVFFKLGVFDTQYTAPGDYEFLLRLARAGLRAVRVPQFLSLFYQNAQGLSFQSLARSRYEGELIYAKYREEMPIERLFAVNPAHPESVALGWVALGNYAMNFQVPWLDNFSQEADFAITCYERALARSPRQPAALNNLAVGRVLKGQLERAEPLLQAMMPAQLHQFVRDLKSGNLKLVQVNIPPAVEPLEYCPPNPSVAVPNVAAPPKPAKPIALRAPAPRCSVRWVADFLSPGEFSSDSIDAVLASAPYLPTLATLDHTEVYSDGYAFELPAPAKAAILATRANYNFMVGGITIATRPPNSFFMPEGALYNIGRTAIEADAVPVGWVPVCNQMREIWVSSNFALEIFARSGVERSKLRLVPISVDANAFFPDATVPADLPGRAAWNYLFCDDWSERSGWDELLNAYFKEFSAADDVCLYLGSRLPGKTRAESTDKIRQQTQQMATAIGSTARFEVISFPDSDLPRVLQACDCVVLPARAEGWGRNQLQAMLMEKPVIATGWGAHMDFCKEDQCYLIDFKMVEIRASESSFLPLRGLNWAAPSPEHLRALLRKVQLDPATARTNGRGQRAALAAAFDRLPVGSQIATRLAEIEQKMTTASCDPVKPRIPVAEAEFSGPPAHNLQVAWEGSFLDYGSLSHVNRELTAALSSDRHLQVTRVSQTRQSAPPELKNLATRIRNEPPRQANVTVRHGWPPDWKAPAAGLWVLIQPWEFGILPANWLRELAKVDEIWAPTEYVRRVYVDSGVHPSKVKIVPNGIDPTKFQPGLPAWPLDTKKKFKFLFVGGTIHRKGPDVLLKSYLESFTAADDVCLVIKDFGGKSIYEGQTLAKEIAAAQLNPNSPEILHLTDELPVEAMPRLYAACQCLVHPYRGEGFGLPVLEAMACGLPVVVTGGGATDDFASDEYAYRLPALRTPITDKIGGLKLCRHGWWLEPVPKALAERLRWIVAHPDEARDLGRAASDYVRREWTWERAAGIAGSRLRSLVARKGAETGAVVERRARRAGVLALPDAGLAGQLRVARELLGKKNFPAAWNSALAAIAMRPFHCEGFLLLAEIARTAGDLDQARRCGERARELAPDWKPAKQLLKGLSTRGRALEWPALPAPSKTPRLTVCLITRNEAQFLGQCLESIRDVAYQIIVVDTGSTDATVEIAREFQAKVYHFPWNDDFSAARNEALKHATGDWILSLDADEELLPEHRETIRAEMQTTGVIAYRLPIIDKGKEKEGCSYVPRLFRNAPGLFFVGRVHEQVFTSIVVRAEEWGLKNELGKSALLHHGYTKEMVQGRDKIARNLRLLELAMEELPNEPNLVMNYGLELVRSGQLQAGLEQSLEALHLLSRLPAGQVVPELRETLLTQLGTQLMAARAFDEIVKLWQTPLAKSAAMTASQHFVLGLAQIETGHHAEAVEQMRHCLAKRRQPTLSPINQEIHKAGPNHCLALSLVALKQDAAAAEAFRAALADDPKSVSARFDFARFQFQQRQPVAALQLLHELVTEKNGDLPVWELGGQIALSQAVFLDFAQNWTLEAIKHFPKHPVILLQHAESLLLSQQVEAALPFWLEAHSPKSARHLAALTLCEVLAGNCLRHFPPADELVVSQEFLKWYRQLIAFDTRLLVRQINEKLADLRGILPSAANVLAAAMKKAEAALVS